MEMPFVSSENIRVSLLLPLCRVPYSSFSLAGTDMGDALSLWTGLLPVTSYHLEGNQVGLLATMLRKRT